MNKSGIRIAKFLADAGLCSRREAERMIGERRVKVDGAILDTPAFLVDQQSKVTVDDKEIKPDSTKKVRLWKLYKPSKCLTTNYDPAGRTTVFSYLPKLLPRLIAVGRLDYNTEGILLFTNSGELARQLELPSSNIGRVYKVKIYGVFNPDLVKKIVPQIEIKGMIYNVKSIKIISSQDRQTWLEVCLLEGKNREIRNIFEYLGFKISRLVRISYGDIDLAGLKSGELMEVKRSRLLRYANGAE